jgi:hypothetical protein
MSVKRGTVSAVGAALLASVGIARADGKVDDAAYRDAKRLMAEARKLDAQGRYADARLKLREACTVLPGFGCLRGLASVESNMGLFVEAYDHFVQASHADGYATASPEDKQTFEKERQQAFAHTGHLEIVGPTNAALYLGETFVGTSPLSESITVKPGTYTIEVRTPERTQKVELTATEGRVVHVEFRGEGPAAETPASAAPSSIPASSTLPAAASTSASTSTESTVTSGPMASTSWWSTKRTVGAIAAATGGLSFGLDAFLWSQGHTAPTASVHDSYVVPTWITFGVGVAGIAMGGVLILWPESRSRTALLPFATPSTGGLQLRGDF